MRNLATKSNNFYKVVLSNKFDIAFVFFVAALAINYHLQISQIVFPVWDAAIYLENAQDWLRNETLDAAYRPPLISWIIAGVWSITGEDWTIAKYIQPVFTLGAAVILYLTLKKHKGDFFAFGVTALTMLNPYVLIYSKHILTEGISLFFLVLSIYFLKSENRYSWIFAGIAMGLTFGSRYPVFIVAVVIFLTELITQLNAKKLKLFAHTMVGLVPICLLIISAVYIKSGSFTVAIERDTRVSLFLSLFYVENFIQIFGFISLLLPIALLLRRTYIDRYNHAYIAWFIFGFLAWSAISENQQERFMIQITPAVYFLSALAIEDLWKRSKVLTVSDLSHGAGVMLKWAAFAARWISFFPFRYYLCAFVIAYLSLSHIDHLLSIEEQILQNIFHFFSITYTLVDGELYTQIQESQTAVSIPIYLQLVFLIFFPTIALVSRINMNKRLQFLFFGLLCFLAFVMISFLTVLIPIEMSSAIRHLISILLTLLVGGLMIEFSIWNIITIPKPTKIKRIIKRSYTKEYLLLLSVLSGSTALTVCVIMILDIPFNSAVILYALLTISSISSVSYLLANLIYEINRQRQRRRLQSKNEAKYRDSKPQQQYNPTISFLLPAYNEEQIIGKCIESIDRAAAKYGGKTEIVVVNDGSKDNTKKVVTDSINKLKYAHGKIFTILNSGKGFALNYGLKRISGEIVFRMDADSLVDKDAISHLVEHFKDPLVGSVSGFIFPLEAITILGKAQNVLFASYLYVKRAQEVFDSIIVQPGASTAFRTDALLKIGGWTDNQFGEDGEISSRIARFGYKSKFEQHSIVYSDLPQTLSSFLAQRSRWGFAYYHSRGRNLEQVKELASPRALVFLHNLESHGAGFGLNFAWVLIAAAVIAGNTNFFLADVDVPDSFLATLFIKLTGVHVIITASQVLLYAYALKKLNRLSDIKYYPVMRFLNIILSMWVKIVATEAVLSWSSKWSRYNDEAFKDLRKYMHRNIDPNYPEAVETNGSVLFDNKHSTTG
jgi:cellulose synthase/poly-beta-1,6-N-acetylglucosamine synthase-like glycosyltransferase